MPHDLVDMETVRGWLELLHGSGSGFLHVCATGQFEGAVCETVDQAAAYVLTTELRQPTGIYLRNTTIRERLAPGKRGGADDSACLPGLWGDVDIAGAGHKTDKPLPQTEADAVQVVTSSGLPEPSVWIRSGGGLYPWWLLNEPRCVDSADELDELKWLSATWQDLIAYSAKKLGWFYGTEVKDLARVLRIPGTINRKIPGDPKMVHIAMDLGGGTRYTIDELFDAAVDGLPKVERPERKLPLPAKVINPNDDGLSPGDALEAEPWDSDLLLAGWQLHHQVGQTCYWTRPGKNRKDGYSATTGYDHDRDRLYVFSSSTPLPVEEPLNKFAVHTYLHHGGDFAAAAASLRRSGLGGRQIVTVQMPAPDEFKPALLPASPPEPDNLPVLPGDEPVEPPPAEGATVTVQWARFSWDDLGNGERFAFRYGDRARWLVDAGSWALYKDGCWSQVTEAPIDAMVGTLVNELPRLELKLYDGQAAVAKNGKDQPSEQERFAAWVCKQRFDSRLRAMRHRATGRTELQATMDQFDRDPMLLNCHNGVLDLRTGTLSAPGPEYMFMQRAQVNWNENAQCPRWLKYLEQVMPDPETRDYLQRITGYSLTADVSERVIFLHHGHGDNGKSIYLDVIGSILGSYCITVGAETLMTKQFQSNHNADVARMAKKRFLRASETNVGKHLDEGQVKLLAGGDDVILARYPYQRFPFEFSPTGKIHLATNHAPEVSDTNSIWRRIKLMGWNVTIPRHNQNRYLAKELLAAEASGIFTWAMQGCLKWQQNGLDTPASLEVQELELRSSQSVIGQFLEDCVSELTGNRESFTRLYQVYRMWCENNGARVMSGKAFSMSMVERGYRKFRTMEQRGFMDVRVVTPMQAELGWNQD